MNKGRLHNIITHLKSVFHHFKCFQVLGDMSDKNFIFISGGLWMFDDVKRGVR